MSKTANINLRVDPELKSEVEKLYRSFGISVTEAINMFLHVSLLHGGLPFDLRQPRYNAQTKAAMEEARLIASGKIKAKHFSSAEVMMNDILSDGAEHA